MSSHDRTTPVEYRQIEGFPGYHVGSDGTVWVAHNTRRRPSPWRQLRGTITPKGYRRVMLRSAPGQHAMKMAHDLVLTAFVGERPRGHECCHYNGDKLDNRLANLRWDTPGKNQEDRVRLGEMPDQRGSKNGRAKLGESDVAKIKAMVDMGFDNPTIAGLYAVTSRTICKIRYGWTWKHVEPDPIGLMLDRPEAHICAAMGLTPLLVEPLGQS